MRTTDTQLAALRAMLTDDSDAFERLSAEPEVIHGDGFPVLTAAAFVAAARRRFVSGWTIGDVIRFVGHVRAHDDAQYADISADAAEHLLLCALRGVPFDGVFAEEAKGYAQVTLLTALVSDLDQQQLDAFLEYSRVQADQWLLGHPPGPQQEARQDERTLWRLRDQRRRARHLACCGCRQSPA